MRLKLALLLLVLLLAPSTSFADPGPGAWLSEAGNPTTGVFQNQTIRYTFSDLTKSIAVQVHASVADVCLISKDGGTQGGLGRATMYRVIRDDSPITVDAILVPAIPADGSDCIVIVYGRYWVEPDAVDTPSSTVTITGRVR